MRSRENASSLVRRLRAACIEAPHNASPRFNNLVGDLVLSKESFLLAQEHFFHSSSSEKGYIFIAMIVAERIGRLSVKSRFIYGRCDVFPLRAPAYLLFIESHRLSPTLLMATRKVARCLLGDLKACGIEERWRTNTAVECNDREISTSSSQLRRGTEGKTFATRLTGEKPFPPVYRRSPNTCTMSGD